LSWWVDAEHTAAEHRIVERIGPFRAVLDQPLRRPIPCKNSKIDTPAPCALNRFAKSLPHQRLDRLMPVGGKVAERVMHIFRYVTNGDRSHDHPTGGKQLMANDINAITMSQFTTKPTPSPSLERHDLPALAGFVVRCVASAALSYFVARALGLPHPVWAPVSALVVTQEDFSATRASIWGRLFGTVIGALISLAVHRGGLLFGLPIETQIAVAVGICAVGTWLHPAIRVCMWTCPLVLLTASPDESPEFTAFLRTSEVLLGVFIGGALHFAEARLMLWLRPWMEHRPVRLWHDGHRHSE